MYDPLSLRALLAWASLPGVGERALDALLKHAREARLPLVALWQSPPADLAALLSLSPRAAAALDERRPALWNDAAALAAWMNRWGVEALTPGVPEPTRLRGPRWPLLFACGNLDLLDESLVLLANSRDPSAEAIRWTDAAADALARRDVALATGVNREAYQAAAVAAKRHGGAAVMALDRGLLTLFPAGPEREPVPGARVWDEMLDPATQLLLSPFALRDQWTPRSGPRRDSLLFELAAAVVAVDVRPGGNIERECRRAIERGIPLFALDRGTETAGGSRALAEILPPAHRLPAALAPDEVAARLHAALPATAERDRAPSWEQELGPFLLAAGRSLQPERLPDKASVAPAQGELARAARESAIAPALARGEGASGLDLLIAGLDPGARPGDLAARLEPGGLLVAAVPAAWLNGSRFAAQRQEFLAAGTLLTVVQLPIGDDPAAVLLYRRGRSASAPATQLIAPPGSLATRHQLRRYLLSALGSLSGLDNGVDDTHVLASAGTS